MVGMMSWGVDCVLFGNVFGSRPLPMADTAGGMCMSHLI